MPSSDEYNEKIEFLRRSCGLYNIAFRRAGVGLIFFEPPDDGTLGWEELADEGDPYYSTIWQRYLKVYRYYPTLAEAVDAAFNNRQLLPESVSGPRDRYIIKAPQ